MTKNIYRTFAREEQLEKDLKELEDRVNKDIEEEKEKEILAAPDDNLDSEEKTFKKRYSDLRSYSQKQLNEASQERQNLESRIQQLESQLSDATKQQIKYPSTDEEVEYWMQKYPDVTRNIETIVLKRLEQQKEEFSKQLKVFEEDKKMDAKRRAYSQLLSLHPDFEEIVQSEEFKNWIKLQPKAVHDSLYKNDTDAQWAAFTIDSYKALNPKSQKGQSSRDDTRSAARNVRTSSNSESPEDQNRLKFTESVLKRMSLKELEKHEKEIEEAMKDPRFWDISVGAR